MSMARTDSRPHQVPDKPKTYQPGSFSARRLAYEHACNKRVCLWCMESLDEDSVCVGCYPFCDTGCAALSKESGLSLLNDKSLALRAPTAYNNNFQFRPVARMRFSLLTSEINENGPCKNELRKMATVYETLGDGGFKPDTILLWFSVGPFLFYWRDEIQFDDASQREMYEAGAFCEMLKQAFYVRKSLRTLAVVQMHLELARRVEDQGQPILLRSALRLEAQDTCEVTPCGRGTNIAVNGKDYLSPIAMVPDASNRENNVAVVKLPLAPVVMSDAVRMRMRPFLPHSLRLEEVIKASTIEPCPSSNTSTLTPIEHPTAAAANASSTPAAMDIN